MAALTVAEIFGHILAEEIQGDRLSAIVDLAFTYPEFAIALKRGHDRNMPLWLLIVFFGASAVLDLLTVLEMTGTEDEPSIVSLAIALPFTVLGLALLVELGFRRGTPGPNQYGPDPLAPGSLTPRIDWSSPRDHQWSDMTADPVAIARDLVRCRSVTPDEGGALGFLQGLLAQAGFTVHRAVFAEPGTAPIDNLYARIGLGKAQSAVRRTYRRGAAGQRNVVVASAVCRRSRGRHALRPRRGRHEGRHRRFRRRGARLSRRQWRQAERLDLAPDHRRRGERRGQRHHQASEMGGRARRKIRSLHSRRAEQCRSRGRHHQGRTARLAQRHADRHRPPGPRRLSRARRQSDPRACHADRRVAGAARPRQRAVRAVESRIHLGRCRQSDGQSHSRRSARAFQHPLQRPPQPEPRSRR